MPLLPMRGLQLIIHRAPVPSIKGFISPMNLSLFTMLRNTMLIASSGKPDSSVKV
jgi:hypothetical protein